MVSRLGQVVGVLICLLLRCPIGSQDIEDNLQFNHFNVYDLVVINGFIVNTDTTYQDEIGLFIEKLKQGCGLALVSYVSVHYENKDDAGTLKHKCHRIPIKMLRPFKPMSMKKSSNRLDTRLTSMDRVKIINAFGAHLSIMQGRSGRNGTLTPFWQQMDFVPDEAFFDVFCGFIWKNFGMNGLFYVNDKNFDATMEERFILFYQKYLRLRPRLLSDAEITISVQKGDLVKVKKKLKQQKNECLQARAAYFAGSFGRIITSRKNKRNQTEYEIQSLFEKDMKLALRPKYLSKITKIYLHCRKNGDLIANGMILYLPYYWDETHEIGIFGMDELQGLICALSHRQENIIIDPIISISFLLLCWNEKDPKASCMSTQDVFNSLSFCMDKINWSRIMNVIEKMKKTSKQKEKTFMEGIEKFFSLHFDKITNSFKDGTEIRGKPSDFAKELDVKIQRDLRKAHSKNLALYTKLLVCIAEETRIWLSEQHPEYSREFARDYNSFKDPLERLYRVSVTQHYLKANTNGKDLHVIHYQDKCKARSLLKNLTHALSAKINTEWNINNVNASALLASEIIVRI